jgi:hypothetical protein
MLININIMDMERHTLIYLFVSMVVNPPNFMTTKHKKRGWE